MSKRTLIIGGVIVLVFAAAAGFYLFQQNSTAQAAANAARQTGTLSRGELAATVSGAGNIIAPEQSELSFGSGAVPITAINVQVGEVVHKGDVLAEQDAAQLQEALETAQLNLASAQAAYEDVRAAATDSEIAIGQAQVRSAQQNYDAAVASLEQIKAGASGTELQAANASLASAQAAYQAAAAKSALTNEQIIVQRATLEKARIALEAAQAAYNTVAWQDNATHSSQTSDLQAATIDYAAAEANYRLSMTDINDSSVKSAEAALVNARQTVAELTAEPSAQELASAQAAVESASQALLQANQDLTDLKAGSSEQELLSAQANVRAAQTAVDQAQRNLDAAKIVAPFDGTVAAVDGFVGETASAGVTVITLVNTANLQTELALSEVDVSQVQVGQEVELAFDALSGKTFPGTVAAISPLGTQSSGVVNYTVTIRLTDPDPSILPGMTAQASIIIQRVDDALIAPSRAVRTQNNRKVMTLLSEGVEIPILVQTGLTSEAGTQIVSATTADGQTVDLQAGDTVVLNSTTTTSTLQGGFGGPPGAGIPGLR